MEQYNHKKIEEKWQKQWEKDNAFRSYNDTDKKKFYALIEFPYPSGDGLHVGHIRSNTAMDIIARKRRREGYNVLYPIGWDAFGLPTENFAIKTGRPPQEITKKNTDTFRRQLKALGFSFDWTREINTTDPSYYKWTQWIFLKLFENDLAYKKKMPINWCLDCKTGLANEEVVDEVCERCGGEVEIREKEQWLLKITKYAERLYDDLGKVDYIESVKTGQRNWIGKSEGAQIEFKIIGRELESSVNIFTTRPDTLFGATYLVLAPEYPEILSYQSHISNWGEVEAYIKEAKSKKDIERTAESREKSGVALKGVSAINPANKEEIPIFVADYVLAHYGTGAIMAVPAHDARDYIFAQKYNLPIKVVIDPREYFFLKDVPDDSLTGSKLAKIDKEENFGEAVKKNKKRLRDLILNGKCCYTGEGHLVSSGEFIGMTSEEAKEKITKKVGGKMKTTFKLRDWIFSRQRYWGEPIPIIHCEKCGMVPVPEKELPVLLPEVKQYKPTDTGESPLSAIDEWVNVACPQCSGEAKRETDTMPNWAGSSWYYLRYTDPHNADVLAGKEARNYWLPVDWYNGGMEHTTLHLLYSRFWHKFLYDISVVPHDEPYAKRTAHGMILAPDGSKMSKSKGNVINPDEVVERLGADTLRVYEMFMGQFNESVRWQTDNIAGSRRFLEKVWRIFEKTSEGAWLSAELERKLHQTIKKAGEDIEQMRFNTAVSALMILANAFEKEKEVPLSAYKTLLALLAPFAPHIAEELWERCDEKVSVHGEPWPSYDEEKTKEDELTIAVQINGKVRGEITVPPDAGEEEIKKQALSLPATLKWTEGKTPANVIYVPGRLVSIVV
ncbi:MAG: leucine--tRNA ligase [Candidatus Paceibacterota bacterium]